MQAENTARFASDEDRELFEALPGTAEEVAQRSGVLESYRQHKSEWGDDDYLLRAARSRAALRLSKMANYGHCHKDGKVWRAGPVAVCTRCGTYKRGDGAWKKTCTDERGHEETQPIEEAIS